ncbi:MAG TPA: hypothetical protein VEL06_14140 [Haliangiales bacterium]|nr:hypothetical protein [Haliangiales bacterium]
MMTLTHQRCLNHEFREAVARCPECKQFFCRECITEHEDRVVCAACLKKLARTRVGRRLRFAGLAGASQFLLGVLTAWLFFYFVGRSLLAIPDSFHEGTVWRGKFMDLP